MFFIFCSLHSLVLYKYLLNWHGNSAQLPEIFAPISVSIFSTWFSNTSDFIFSNLWENWTSNCIQDSHSRLLCDQDLRMRPNTSLGSSNSMLTWQTVACHRSLTSTIHIKWPYQHQAMSLINSLQSWHQGWDSEVDLLAWWPTIVLSTSSSLYER
jgi:hypothetical protein